MATHRPLVLRPRVDRLDDRCLLSTGPTGLSPAQLTQAYGLNNLTSSSGKALTGAGQTIALIEAYTNPNLAQEVAGFDSQFNLAKLTVSSTIGGSSSPTLTQVNLATGPNASKNTNAGWAEEEALDVEWAHAIAPGANILVVEASSASTSSLMAAVVYAEGQKGVTVVSMSWGESEVKSDETTYDADFNKPGIAFVASSGDSGAQAGAEWPAASPYVIGVGGTTLNTTTSGGTTTYVSETAWSNSYGGSGGGLSAFETEPAYQQSVQSSGMRSSPDVAFDADPNTGVAVYYIAPTARNAMSTSGTWLVVGGTSLGAPAWAGIIALVDQSLATQNITALGSTQFLTDLYLVASTSPADFNVVAAAGQTTTEGLGFRGRFTGAQSLPDDDTGLGSPAASNLLAGIVDEAEGVPVPAKGGTAPSTFNGQTVPVKPTGGANSGGTTNKGGTNNGGQGGQQGGGAGAGWWWWFGWSPSGRGMNQASGLFNPSDGNGSGLGLGVGLPSKPSALKFVASSTKPAAPLAVTVATHPWGPAPIGSTSGVLGSIGLLTPVFTPGPAALLPLQNVPNLGPAIDASLASYESRHSEW